MIKKTLSLVIALSWLGFAAYLGQLMYETFDENQHQKRYNIAFSHLAFDVVVIIAIAIFNFFWNNVQLFDAYYSLVPIIRLVLLKKYSNRVYEEFNFKNFLITTLIAIWGVRLFVHIFKKWKGFPDQDKRITAQEFRNYGGIKRIFFWLWQQPFIGVMNGLLISFLTLPVTVFYTRDIALIKAGENYNISELLGYALAIYGLAIQSVADLESNIWRAYSNNNSVCDTGLRRYLRYPQYHGELAFWLGIWGATAGPFSQVIVTNFVYWPIGWVILALWLNVMSSIMDKRVLNKKKEWIAYQNKVRFGLIPFFRF